MLDFARLEFSHSSGDKDKGRTICETVIENYSRRTDAWHIYLDLEMKFGGDLEKIRSLFQRATSMKMSSKKMKAFFKKWLAFEKINGSEKETNMVKTKATEWIEQHDNQTMMEEAEE